jgi:nucleoside-diphosphate-sugar epimerase
VLLFRVPRIQARRVLLCDGTDVLARYLAMALSRRDHDVRLLASPELEAARGDTVVHFAGSPRLWPSDVARFRDSHLARTRGVIAAAQAARARHFVYVSVARPAPIATAFAEICAEAEELVRGSRLNVTILRPWYVVGPGQRWPMLLAPLYWLADFVPAWRDDARRLGLVTLREMIRMLVKAIEQPVVGERVLGVEQIRRGQFEPGGRVPWLRRRRNATLRVLSDRAG